MRSHAFNDLRAALADFADAGGALAVYVLPRGCSVAGCPKRATTIIVAVEGRSISVHPTCQTHGHRLHVAIKDRVVQGGVIGRAAAELTPDDGMRERIAERMFGDVRDELIDELEQTADIVDDDRETLIGRVRALEQRLRDATRATRNLAAAPGGQAPADLEIATLLGGDPSSQGSWGDAVRSETVDVDRFDGGDVIDAEGYDE